MCEFELVLMSTFHKRSVIRGLLVRYGEDDLPSKFREQTCSFLLLMLRALFILSAAAKLEFYFATKKMISSAYFHIGRRSDRVNFICAWFVLALGLSGWRLENSLAQEAHLAVDKILAGLPAIRCARIGGKKLFRFY